MLLSSDRNAVAIQCVSKPKLGMANSASDLALELQKIYDSEINVSISWFWDGGITLRLGDEMSGYVAEETVGAVAAIIPWFQEAIAHYYPTSKYTRSLDLQLLERAAKRLFRPPRIGARVQCPHCGAPHALLMDEVVAFVCAQCGNFVKVDPPKVQ